ncbi:MAG: LysM domain-containing protein [Endomicrobiia bacterium]
MTKLTNIGFYEPTRAYSFEFINRKTNRTITETFLLLPPTEYSLQQGFRVNEIKTANGGYIDDFGNDYKKINIHWDIYFYYLSEPNKPPSTGGFGRMIENLANDLTNVAKNTLNTIGLYDMLSGLDEFFRLRYMLAEGRDISLITGNTIHPKQNDFQSISRFKRTGVDKLVIESEINELNYHDIKVIYHDYDDCNHYEVIIKDFKFGRSAKDPWSFTLDIELLALQPYYGRGYVSGDIERFGDPNEIFKSLNNILNTPLKIVDTFLSGILNLVSIVGACNSFLRQIQTDINTFIQKQELKIENFKNQIKELKKFFDWRTDICDVNKSVIASIPYNIVSNYNNYIIGNETIKPSQTIQNFYVMLTKIIELEVATILLSWFENEKIEEKNELKGAKINPQLKNYPLYKVRRGDTLSSIALKYFGDWSYANIISELNNITFKDFENDGMVNKIIKLPFEQNINKDFFIKNQILSWKKSDYFKNLYEKELLFLGSDLNLIDNNLVIDNNGDLDIITGKICWIENIKDRLNMIEGELNELNPGFGLPIITSNLVSGVLIEKLKQNILEPFLKDSRTKNVFLKDFELKGDELNIILSLKNILDDEELLNFKTQIGVI